MVGSDPSILFSLAVRLNADNLVGAAHGYFEQVAISGYHAPLTPVPAAVPVLVTWLKRCTRTAVMLESLLSKRVSAPCCRGLARRCATFCGSRVSGMWHGIPTNTALQQTARGWAHPGATCLIDCKDPCVCTGQAPSRRGTHALLLGIIIRSIAAYLVGV